MSAPNLVIVESPAKAKTINKYLGPDYEVLASYGHIRDLPPKDGSVRPDEDFAMSWELGDRAENHVKNIIRAAKKARSLYLATDPDREGEAISWHVLSVLDENGLLKDRDLHRVTFNAITKASVQEAFANPRDLDTALVDAYLARRALDYLVGFTLSPVLWRKLPGSRSAGRVQSVALRLITERETEIELFQPREYWTLEALLANSEGTAFKSRLTHLDGKKLSQFDLHDAAGADAAAKAVRAAALSVHKIEKKQVRRNPSPPFITSSLQMEASRKLGFGATKTMRVAQQLYEGTEIGGETVGLITYMRTDGVNLSSEAIEACRKTIASLYGDKFVPEKPRIYQSKQKNAQEAHEAIRPTDLGRLPRDMAPYLENDQARLYELIWKRTIAAEMESAVLDQMSVDLGDSNGTVTLRATGSAVVFDGFMKVYQESQDDKDGDDANDKDRRLPPLKEGEAVATKDVTPEQHFTQPPPRYTEASLVKKLEELGIGRPSTYASIMQVLQDRDYVTLESRRFRPEDRGRLVTAFLANFFERYVEYDFTAQLEEQLDDISGNRREWKDVLKDFWEAFSAAVAETKDLTITQVIDALDDDLGHHFFRTTEEGKDPRACPNCGDGRLGLRLGKTGGFIGCSNYPECRYTRPLTVSGDGSDDTSGGIDKELGNDPETGLPVWLKHGPYGDYVQLGPAPEAEAPAEQEEPEETGAKKKKAKKPKAEKPKRVSLPRNMDPADLSLEIALQLLALPRDIAPHPEDGQMIQAGIGRYGPYVKHGNAYKSLPADEDVLTVGINRAVDLLASSKGRASGVLRELGDHPEDGKPVTLNQGRFGPYVKHGKLMASLRKAHDPDTMNLEEAVALLIAKEESAKAKAAGGKAPAKKTTAKTTAAAAKKAPAKKTTAKKTTATKKTTTKKTTGKAKAGASS